MNKNINVEKSYSYDNGMLREDDNGEYISGIHLFNICNIMSRYAINRYEQISLLCLKSDNEGIERAMMKIKVIGTNIHSVPQISYRVYIKRNTYTKLIKKVRSILSIHMYHG